MSNFDYDKIMEKRKQALLKADELTAKCKVCTLRLPHQFDRKLECCETCPVQKQIYPVRAVLEGSIIQLRRIRPDRPPEPGQYF